MKPIMNLTSPGRDNQSQCFITIFRNFKNQSSVLRLYLGNLKTSYSVLWLCLGILSIRDLIQFNLTEQLLNFFAAFT